jgi:predicted RNA-binding protein with EMAP domain
MKETFFESFKTVQKELKERKVENLNPEELFFKKENEFFEKAEEKISKIPDSKERTSKFQKLKTLALTTTIALGIVFKGEKLVFGERLIEKPAEIKTAEVIEQKEIEKNYETYLKIKEILTPERIKDLDEKIKFLKERYKGETDFPDYSHKLEKIKLLLNTVETLSKSEKKKEEIFSSELVKSLINEAKDWLPLTKEEKLKRAKEHKPNLKLEGINDNLKETLNELLSREDLAPFLISVDEIKVIDTPSEFFGAYLGGAFETRNCFNEKEKIVCQHNTVTIYPKMAFFGPGGLQGIVIHEIAHANDWVHSRVLSIPEKIDFFYDATRIVENYPPYFLKTSFEIFSRLEKSLKDVLKMESIEDCEKDQSCLEFLKKTIKEPKEIEKKDIDVTMIELLRKEIQNCQTVEEFFEKVGVKNLKEFDSEEIEGAKKAFEDLKRIFENDKSIEKLAKEEKDFLISLGFKLFQKKVEPLLLGLKNIKVKEYWAEGMSIYFDPERRKYLPEVHQEFFEKWYKKIIE